MSSNPIPRNGTEMLPPLQIKKAVKYEKFLKLAFSGPSGSGKTYTCLQLASVLAEGGTTLVIDTQHGQASLYADEFTFDTIQLEPPFHPARFQQAIDMASANGYKVVIIDSLSHAWAGPGGLLDVVRDIGKGESGGEGSFRAWAKGSPIQGHLIDHILGAPLHVLVTLRVKQDYAMEKDEESHKTVVRKLGLKPIQRDDVEYEFDVFGTMDMEHNLSITKTVCSALTDQIIQLPGEALAQQLLDWRKGVKPPHWYDTEAGQKRFDAGLEKLGLSMTNALKALGVDMIQSYTGTIDAAGKRLNQWIKTQTAT